MTHRAFLRRPPRPLRAAAALALAAALAGPALAPIDAAPPAAAPFTLDQVLASPFPSNLVASPAGDAVAWTFTARGARSIWVASAPAFTGRAIVTYPDDDGQEVSELTWSPDGRQLLFVRGGGPNRQGEIPNPTSSPTPVEQAIWIVPAAGGEPRRLAQGASLAVSPRGDRVAFVAKGQIWAVALSGEGKPEQLAQARGQARSLRWSPDGRRLAFVSARGTHSFIGVLDIERKTLTFLDPSVDTDIEPAWSPDGRRLAFVRTPRDATRLPFHPEREGDPWSIRVVDVETGAAREVWRAAAGRGSVFYRVVASQQIWWTEGDRIVFPWEREGWVHLYSVPVSGGPAAHLTPGAFEVEYVTLALDRRTLVYNSNQGDIDRRHLWRVDAAGGRPPEALTRGTGIEWQPAPLAGGAVAYLRSDARRPAEPAIQRDGQPAAPLAPGSLPADFPLASLVEPEAVTIVAADGMAIPAQLFRPAGSPSGARHPAVVFFHGGSRRQMLLGWHYGAYYHNAYAFNQYLASRGFVVLSVNYRSGIGYGLEFREALDYGAAGASEFNDVLGAGLYLRSRADVDPARIGLWGGSYGGYLTALGLARASDLFAAGVDVHGVHDWNVVIRNFAAAYDPAARQEIARRAFESSPMAFVDRWRSPVLLIHGDDDRNVPFSETVDLVERLRARSVPFEQLIFPDEVHSFLRHESWLKAFTAAARFFERHLGQPRTTSSPDARP
jgi:dipeptidyl aminopeptidase/acylaminoacyl peptidase